MLLSSLPVPQQRQPALHLGPVLIVLEQQCLCSVPVLQCSQLGAECTHHHAVPESESVAPAVPETESASRTAWTAWTARTEPRSESVAVCWSQLKSESWAYHTKALECWSSPDCWAHHTMALECWAQQTSVGKLWAQQSSALCRCLGAAAALDLIALSQNGYGSKSSRATPFACVGEQAN